MGLGTGQNVETKKSTKRRKGRRLLKRKQIIENTHR